MKHCIHASGLLPKIAAFLMFCLLGVSLPMYASTPDFSDSSQARKVTGKVLDQNGEPVLGAAVMIEGTTNGILVDDEGYFECR